ncbi:hypothetical protein H6F88_31730 [Oculatella sp. FACHB-28]|uniref:CIS tube protein n=1 Tax=Oculatella sp. FACHB-28 TaxID=2692845 RepID=UPI0016863EE4|nr:hypothetical protein [Oculatella sp. FACHB-28]MBD2060514.1 hypothetical protein [Oculatella sp. FACHB-28]
MNLDVLNSLPQAEKTGLITAFLSRLDGTQHFVFLYNPEAIRSRRQALYDVAPTTATSAPRRDYKYTTAITKTFSNLLLETSGEGRSVRPIIEEIQTLMVADVVNNSYEPPLVYFNWGTEMFGPAQLDDLDWEETAWLGGEPASVRLSITLTQVPLPDNQPSQSQPPTADELNTVSLTDRQRQDARAAAGTWLNSNINTLRPRVRERVRSRSFRYLTNANGEVRITDSEGNDLGLVGTYNGTTLDTSRNNVTTQ